MTDSSPATAATAVVTVNRDDLWLVVDAYERRLTPNVAADAAAARLREAGRFPRLDATSDE